MANSYNSLPIVLDTDFVSFKAHQTLQTPGFGIRVYKIALVVAAGGASSAGTIAITDPIDSTVLYPPLPVAASTPAGTVLFTDNIDTQTQWRDFSVTGLTATGTKLMVWYRV